jgi:ribosomal protein L7/L12
MLKGFDPASKIKIIKELKTLLNLGLKEVRKT